MSLNVLVSAAVQRTGLLAPEPADDSAKNKKRRKSSKESSSVVGAATASVASSGFEDEEEKQRKRRAQIAEASRRSRARRKKEFQDFKEENDQLWSQNMMLRKTLEDMGVYVPPPLISRVDRGSSTPGGGASHANSSDDEDNDDGNGSVGPSPVASPMAPAQAHLPQHVGLGSGVPSGGIGTSHPMLHWMAMSSVNDVSDGGAGSDGNASSSPAGFQEFCQFFERRLSWYFTQLKSDAIRSFASHLPFEDKQKIASLAVHLVPKDGTSPAITPSITTAGIAASRVASATHAEQVVDQDKTVRL